MTTEGTQLFSITWLPQFDGGILSATTSDLLPIRTKDNTPDITVMSYKGSQLLASM